MRASLRERITACVDGLHSIHWAKCVRELYRMGETSADQVLEDATRDETLPPRVRAACRVALNGVQEHKPLAALAEQGRGARRR